MNKYAARGILVAALEGQRFVIVEKDGHAISAALDEFREASEGVDFVRVRSANGSERVEVPGRGMIRFATPRGERLRGLSVDVVFIDSDADRIFEGATEFGTWRRFHHDVGAALAASGGEVVRS